MTNRARIYLAAAVLAALTVAPLAFRSEAAAAPGPPMPTVTHDAGGSWFALELDAGTPPNLDGSFTFSRQPYVLDLDPYARIKRGESALIIMGFPEGCGISSARPDWGDAGRWVYEFRCPRADGGAQ